MKGSGEMALIMYDSSEGRNVVFMVRIEDIARRRKELEDEGYEFSDCTRDALQRLKRGE